MASVCAFWAALGPHTPNSAYSAAKFAVKGFSESLVTDFRLNAPHVSVSVVMPGHVGTSLVASDSFQNDALTTAAQAATIILDGVRMKRWRILVGHDAQVLDHLVRGAPAEAYEDAFLQVLVARTTWKLGA
jgi:short-subunit dehydrogenase